MNKTLVLAAVIAAAALAACGKKEEAAAPAAPAPDYALDLSILISAGRENNRDCLSNGERTGKSPNLKSRRSRIVVERLAGLLRVAGPEKSAGRQRQRG